MEKLFKTKSWKESKYTILNGEVVYGKEKENSGAHEWWRCSWYECGYQSGSPGPFSVMSNGAANQGRSIAYWAQAWVLRQPTCSFQGNMESWWD
jgi:hypothetical protein